MSDKTKYAPMPPPEPVDTGSSIPKTKKEEENHQKNNTLHQIQTQLLQII